MKYPIKRALWLSAGAASIAITWAIVIYPYGHTLNDDQLTRLIIVAAPIWVLQPFGSLWMLYQAVRHEAKPFFYVLLTLFVPFAFVWYYVERVRPGKQTSKGLGKV
jgi:hypothetical protein